MKRTQLNFAIDAGAFAVFLFLLSTGLLLRYHLPPGGGRLDAVGTGQGAAERPVTILWGWTRHEWGQIHYWIAGLLITVLAVHLALHWKWIVCVVGGARSDASGLRFGLGLASLAALVLVAAAPLLAPRVLVTRGELRQQLAAPEAALEPSTELKGSMTLAEVATATNLSVSEVLNEMDLPSDVAQNERIGRLLRQHGLQMSDLKRILGSDDTIETKETDR
jgi:hypothetical protein